MHALRFRSLHEIRQIRATTDSNGLHVRLLPIFARISTQSNLNLVRNVYESLLMQQDHYVHLDSCLRAHFVVVALSVPADLRTRLLDPLQEVLRRLVLAKVANVTADKPKKILPDLLASSVQVLKSEKQLHLQRRHGSVIGLGLSCMRCRSSIFLANKRPVSVAGCSFHQDDDIEKPCQGTGDKVRVVEPG